MNAQQMATGIYLGRQNECKCLNKAVHHRPSTDNWKYAVKQIKKEMFSSTGVGLPAPDDYLTGFEGTSTATEKCDYCKSHETSFDFNADPFYCKDVLMYRRQRSEHLLFRLTHILGHIQTNVLRIYQGVFVVQQTKPKEQPAPSPQQQQQQQQQQYDLLESILNSDTQFTLPEATQEDFDSIFTFDYNNVLQLISNDTLETPMTTNSPMLGSKFIPYSYTVGARYTNPGGKQFDMMIRGEIPPWCQTLLLDAFYRASPPIKANQTRYDLIPFTPEVPLSFISMTDKKDKVDDPELLLWYERLAMDTSDHELYGGDENTSPEWETARLDILNDVLLCDISSDDAYFITALGNSWAERQGYIVE